MLTTSVLAAMDTHKESTVFMHVLLAVSLHRGSTDCCSLERGSLVGFICKPLAGKCPSLDVHWQLLASWIWKKMKNICSLFCWASMFPFVSFLLILNLPSNCLSFKTLLYYSKRRWNSLKWRIPHWFLTIFVLFGNVSMFLGIWKVRTPTARRCEKIDPAFSGCSSWQKRRHSEDSTLGPGRV